MNKATARNIRVQNRYDELMTIGRHGHYETMFRIVREEVELAEAIRDAEIAGLHHIIDEEAKDSALVIIERDQLREQVKMLSTWIKQQGEITDTCTFNILREVCENCACHRNKALAATEPTAGGAS